MKKDNEVIGTMEYKKVLQDMRQTLDAMCDVLIMLCERDRDRDKLMSEFFANSFSSTSNHIHRRKRLEKIKEGKDEGQRKGTEQASHGCDS